RQDNCAEEVHVLERIECDAAEVGRRAVTEISRHEPVCGLVQGDCNDNRNCDEGDLPDVLGDGIHAAGYASLASTHMAASCSRPARSSSLNRLSFGLSTSSTPIVLPF